ncbi:MAG: SBBP repeat-containing protein, partial [Bacteroidia bacterium]|nr:SBBP repeat-containing protein [Bacteroidia bacterium]
MKPYQFIPALLLVLFCSSVVAQVPYPFAWVKSTTSTSSTSESISSSYTDPNGNTYVVGKFTGTADFDPGPSTFNLTANTTDVFIAKYTALGALVWAKSFTTATSSAFLNPTDIAVDASGNVYVCGIFSETVDFDPGTSVYNLSSTGGPNPDIFLVKLSSPGNFVWAGQIGGVSFETVSSIAVDGSDIYVTGRFQDTTDFDMGPGVSNLIPGGGVGSVDPFVAKYTTASGALVWAKQFKGSGGFGFSSAEKILISSSNVLVTGFFSSTVDFDPGSGVFNLTSTSGAPDFFICQLNSAGNFMWAKSVGGAGMDLVNSMTVDNLGNILLCGTFDMTVDFDPGPGTVNITPISSPTPDFFVLKLDLLGNYVWAKGIGGPQFENAKKIITNSTNDIFIVGHFMDTVDFDPGPGTAILNATSGSVNNGFILKLSSTGNFQWVKQLSTSMSIYTNGIGLDSFENLYITGDFNGTCDFDPGSGTVNLTADGIDAFILKLNASSTSINQQSLVENQFKVYPTVAQEYLYIHPSQPANYLLQIIDVQKLLCI